jgi:hypothetical protein
MTQRMFVCHAKSDIEVTSEIVDSLEAALELPSGTLVASSLPGYASEIHGEGELHATLTGAALMLAIFTERSTYDPEFVFELGAAWALGIDVVPLMLGATHAADLPWPLRERSSIRPTDAGAWNGLMQQLSQRLQVSLRESVAPPLSAAVLDGQPEPERTHSVSIVAPVMVAGAPARAEKPLPPDAFEPPSAVRPSLPTYQMSLEAGRALSDCVFNRAESIDFIAELKEPFGRFVDAMGGSWSELSKLQDFDVWLGVTENLLQNLPADSKRIADWYELGYELATLHNLAGQGLFDTPERVVEAERLWREALERFLDRAEKACIPYEDLAAVMALLENLVAPETERDLANIARSLDVLRQQAVGADQHSAA